MVTHKESESSSETRKKILETAQRLFSEAGFDGTSIRKIASESQVNLAAINYHFKNKENLFWEIISESYNHAEELCKSIAENSKDLEDYVSQVFKTFTDRRELVRNTMKLLLTDRMSPPPDSEVAEKMNCSMGPPGGSYLIEFLNREVPFELNRMGQIWGVKIIFGTIIHWTLRCSTTHFQMMCESDPLFAPEQISEDLAQLVRSTLAHLKSNPKIFKS